MTNKATIERLLQTIAGLLALVWVVGQPLAAPVSIAPNPLFITVNIAPNLVVTLDDSGSMGRAYVPDLCGTPANPSPDDPNCYTGYNDSFTPGGLENRFVKSAHFNPLYFDPSITYSPAKDASGNELVPCSNNSSDSNCLASVYINPFATSKGTLNLLTGFRPAAGYSPDSSTSVPQWDTVAAAESYYKRFAKHYASDVRCKTNNPNINTCQYKDGTGTWQTPGTQACANNTQCQTLGLPPYYYAFDTTNASCTPAAIASNDTDNDCYDLTAVPSSQYRNFANWYAFYRTRNLMTVTAISRAMANLDSSTRVAWQSLAPQNTTNYYTNGVVNLAATPNACNSFGTTCKGWDGVAYDNRIRTFSSNKADFYAWLFRLPTYPPTSTPLRTAYQRAGNYFTTSGVNSPYAQDPQVSVGTEYACRKNFQIVMTDGRWSSFSDSLTALSPTNQDNSSFTLPDSVSYTARAPYKDSNSTSLADLAFYYWHTDLRTDLANIVTPYVADLSGTATDQYWNAKNDPAQWQHLSSFNIGLGVSGYFGTANNPLTWGGDTYSGSFTNILAGTTNWPATASNSDANIADLWHAAINSRGQFFSSESPDALNLAFEKAVQAIQAANPSSAALSANSTNIQAGTLVYQAKFDSKDWSGTLLALPVQGDGSIGSVQWDASTKIPAHAQRNIYTFTNGSARSFDACNGANYAAVKAVLDLDATGANDGRCAGRLAWLRGDASQEVRNGGVFRNRTTTVMGDIINSDPAFVWKEDFGYSVLSGAEGSTYPAFVGTKSSRVPMVYVGANDGMLHAIRADLGSTQSGEELFAYVPSGVYGNLSQLTDPAYSHHYYVDGAPTSGDAYWGGAWHSVLVGGLNSGGQQIYALEITTPTAFSAGNVLWEYTDADMGLTYSQPQIARLNNGVWAAIFGNGYNSTTQQAYLYVVNLQTGGLIKKIAVGTAGSNGLSTPVLLDTNNDGITDYVYAGDLQGQMWKFDLSSPSSALWDVAFGGAPLFTARSPIGGVQPITSQPKVTGHTSGGYMVFFGTGQYLGTFDVNDLAVQTYYGIWDNSLAITTTDRSELQAQTITYQGSSQGFSLRTTSQNSVNWTTQKGWYLDLVPPSPLLAQGERVISTSIIKGDRVIFVTLIPNTDPCLPGGESWLMELNTLTGGAPADSVFDLNNDNVFDALDYVNSNVVSGMKSTVGISKTPVWLSDTANPGIAFKELSGTSGGIATIKNKDANPVPPGGGGSVQRVYWMEIR